MAQAQGSKRIYRNRDGADAVVWSIQPSVSVIKKNADGSVSSDMKVTAYKTVGSTTTTYDWANGIILPGQPRAYYSIDGGSWTQCKPLSMDGGDGVMVKAYVGVTKNTLANVGIGIRFKLMYNGADVAFSPQLPVVKDGADGASINIRGHVIGHGFDEGEYGTWRENSDVTAEMRKKPYLVDNYGNNGVKTQVIHTPDGAMYGDIALYCETKENDAWVSDVDGHLWVWTAEKWADRGQFKGEPGADGSDGEKGNQGDPGADAVVFELKASVGFLKVEQGYTFSNPIQVMGYRTVGSKVTSYNFVTQKMDEPAALAQYCIDGGDWVGCDMLRKGSGSLVMATYGVGISASTLNSSKPKKYVKFRMTYGGTVVATTPEIQLVGDGLSVRGPQMWVNVKPDYQFYDKTLGNEWFDMVVHNNVFYYCKLSHTKIENSDGTCSPEPGNDGGEYWQATEKQEIVATYLLLAEKALIENLVVNDVKTRDDEGNIAIMIHDRIIQICGQSGKKNIEFGIDDTGMAVMRYYDNDGNLKYDLGPNGLRSIDVNSEYWEDIAMLKFSSDELDTVVGGNFSQWAKVTLSGTTTYYRYHSNTINGKVADEENNLAVLTSQSISGSRLNGWVTSGKAEIYAQKKNETEFNVLVPVDIHDSNLDTWFTKGCTKVYVRLLVHYTNGKPDGQQQNVYFSV